MKEFIGAFIKFTNSTFMAVVFEIASTILHCWFILYVSMHFIKETTPIVNAMFGCFIGLLEFLIVIRAYQKVHTIVTNKHQEE